MHTKLAGSVKTGLALKLGVIGSLVLAQSIPNTLLTTLVPVVFREIGVPLEQFWLITVAGLPVWIKWMWAPLLDRTGSERFGYRKTWLAPMTVAAALTYVAIGMVEPTIGALGFLVFLMTLKTVTMSVQDVAVDGYTVENLNEGERAPGAAVIRMISFLSLILVNGALLPLYDVYGWHVVMIGAGLSMMLLSVPALLRKEAPLSPEKRRRIEAERKVPIVAYSVSCFKRFIIRREAKVIAAALLALGITEGYFVGLIPAFLVDKGLSATEVGLTLVAGSVFGALLGAIFGSRLINRIGMRKTALFGPLLLIFVTVPLFFLDTMPTVTLLASSIAVSISMFSSIPIFIMVDAARLRWSSKEQAGTDYSIMSAIYNGSKWIGVGLGGFMAGTFGYGVFFLATIPLGLIALAIFYFGLGWIERENPPSKDAPSPSPAE